MANRNFPSGGKIYSFHVMPVQIDLDIAIGASGAVSSFSGPGVAAVTRLSAGIYQVQLQDNYNQLFQVDGAIQSPVTGSAVTAGSFSVGTVYQIVTLGTTNWTTAGLPAGLVPAVGQVFKAAVVGSGTGTVKALGPSGIIAVENIGGGTMLAPNPSTPNLGGYVLVQCLGATSSSVTTLIPTDPANGSVLGLTISVSNSSVQ